MVAGNIAALSVSGYVAGSAAKIQTQTIAASTYGVGNGSAAINFPASTASPAFFSGQESLYFSPDGNFVFGGSPGGFDMLAGVRNLPSGTAPAFAGLYYQVGADQDFSQFAATGFANFLTQYGAFDAASGSVVAHERLESVFNANALGYTFSDSYPAPLVSSYNDAAEYMLYKFGIGGKYRIGAGTWPYLGLNVAVQAPTLSSSGSGPWLNPQGVVNAASFAPFTAGISDGELIVLYGNNLASAQVTTPLRPLPTTLGGVTVSINGYPAPIYYVLPGQVAVVVPYEITYSIAQIQLTNNGVKSNTVTTFVYQTTPGVFTGSSGLGYGYLQHADYSLITPSHPAAPGETIIAYVTGLGASIRPFRMAGLARSGQPSFTFNPITGGTGGSVSTALFSGLVPTVSALYQVNLTVLSTAANGDQTVDIGGPDSLAAQALIPVAKPAGSVRRGTAEVRAASHSSRVPDETRIVESGHAIRQAIPALGIRN